MSSLRSVIVIVTIFTASKRPQAIARIPRSTHITTTRDTHLQLPLDHSPALSTLFTTLRHENDKQICQGDSALWNLLRHSREAMVRYDLKYGMVYWAWRKGK
jgi:hypothetical protein